MRDNVYVRAAITILTVLVMFASVGCVSRKNVTGDSVSMESTDTSFEADRRYRSTYSETEDTTENEDYWSYSDQADWSSGYSTTDNLDSLNNDPDDYDTPEDYADDAWGDDFDDWDDAYEYWEDSY